ncbi:uncharacterized protein PV09_00977 [Verruconis gallopava]|uniref:polynucleotide adenylyltransferase n=1 Tax=Verruconis gallopava TaxID=253628 RepID=A0A0D2AMW6_9PEZI|nr:uncharacterized protein PV09_00977 [Verruconis gallopava]KIW08033.1 hypothetical protein PV09_00977 [Verruconis gallopava]
MQHDIYRPGGYRDRDDVRDSYDRGPGHYNRRDDRYDSRRDDQRHPYEWYRSRSQSRSPPHRRAHSPRPRATDMYRFGGDNRQSGVNGLNDHGQRGDFTFRSGQQREFRSGQPPSREPPRGPRRQRTRDDRRAQGKSHFQTRRHGPQPAHERKILHADNDKEGTPERLTGMAEGISRFKTVDDLFESESEGEAAMDLENPVNGNDDEPSAKRTRTDGDNSAPGEKPKWSNPDPYYLIPPLDESRGKRKDVVQLIRKAKVEIDRVASAVPANAVTQNADFIGFGDDDNEDADADEESSTKEPSEEGEVDSDEQLAADPANSTTMGASTSSSSKSHFSHLRNLHQMPAPKPSQDLNALASAPQVTTKGSEEALDEARELLAEINAEDDAALQLHGHVSTKHGKKRKLGADGEITDSWAAKDRASSVPWYIDHSAVAKTSTWLHKEINDFYDFIKPRSYEAKIRQDLVDRLQRALQSSFRGAQVHPFGSYGQGIFLPTSDMDLVLLSPEFQRTGYPSFNKSTLYRIRNLLTRSRISSEQNITVIARAKVPIIKFVDTLTGLNCDLSLDNDSGLKALTTFGKWQRTWPFLPKLLSVLKQWLLMRGVNEVYTGGLGGFSLTCMLVSMLQMQADGQTTNLEDTPCLGQLLLQFFDLYGNKFNMNKVGISLNPAEYINKAKYGIGKDDRWTIIDPHNPSNDLSIGSSQARLIQRKFSETYSILIRTMRSLEVAGPVLRKGQTLLGLIIGGNYERVILQRSILREVYGKNFGPVDEPETPATSNLLP